MANQNQNGQQEVVVVMVPFPAQGHLNQLLHLSRLILSYHIPVYYVGSTIHVRQAKSRIQGWNPIDMQKFHFQEFSIPYFPSPPPNPKDRFPSHLQPSFESSVLLREPLNAFVSSLASKSRRVVVIFDSVMKFVGQDVASIPNGESYCFQSVCAYTTYMAMEAFRSFLLGKVDIPKSEIPTMESLFSIEMLKFLASQVEFKELYSGLLFNTSKVIDGSYIDLLAKESNMDLLAKESTFVDKKAWAIGPFNPVKIAYKDTRNGRHFCVEWLDKQEPNSVIYVSFGSTTSLEDEQVKELALGLEQSKQKFIWVLRYADVGDIFTGEKRTPDLPAGYEERVKDIGLILREWAPQLDILSHPSTGGFMSHCGWNSCMESITMGVPIAAWPMHSDQPINTMLITKVLHIGIVVREWGKGDEIVASTTIENVVIRLMASKEGDLMRKMAAELGESVRESVEEGGVSRLELDSFIAHITR